MTNAKQHPCTLLHCTIICTRRCTRSFTVEVYMKHIMCFVCACAYNASAVWDAVSRTCLTIMSILIFFPCLVVIFFVCFFVHDFIGFVMRASSTTRTLAIYTGCGVEGLYFFFFFGITTKIGGWVGGSTLARVVGWVRLL